MLAARAQPLAPWQATMTLRLDPDGTAELLVLRVEMGQGAHAGLHALVCDELGLVPEALSVRMAPVERRFGGFFTGASYTAALAELRLRPAVAGVRWRLEQAAASLWGVAVEDCSLRGGWVRHEPTGRQLAIRELLADAARLPEPSPAAIRLRGSPPGLPRPPAPHAQAVVDGLARYGIDQRAVGQRCAVLARAPSLNARLRAFDARACKEVPGFLQALALTGNRFPALNHVREAVAVVATGTWAAEQARQRLTIEWDEAPESMALDDAAIAQALQQAAPWPDHEGWRCELQLPAYPHLPMEPPNALAEPLPDGGLRVSTGTQRQTRLLDALEREQGWPAGQVHIEVPLLGGGFGRRLEVDYALEAAALARHLKAPVQLLWTREDDIRFGLYRPPSLHRIVARLDAQGRLVRWTHAAASVSVFQQQQPAQFALDPGDSALRVPMLAFPYAVPEVEQRPAAAPLPLPAGWWRGVAWTQVTVAVEQALNRLAATHAIDAVALRLQHLPPLPPRHIQLGTRIDFRIDTARLRQVLERVAARAGWPLPRAAPACGFYDCDGTYVATIAQADADGRRIERLWVSVDCGRRLCDDIVRQQVEGSVAFALTALKSTGVHWRRGRVIELSLSQLPLLTLAEWPELDIDLVDSGEAVSGIGEPVVPPVLAAAASALETVAQEVHTLRRAAGPANRPG